MPVVRFTVKNEYGLGVPELYNDAVKVEDPKAVLDGVTVSGLVGLLRQLGDLSEFAAQIFHGLQEQVASTTSRSRKLVTRVQRVEASLPSLEKAILSQTSHIHFAYTPGSQWHARIRNERNHFICNDLPHFIMDSYEECREPPRLQLLDRFDTGGPGSCLKRYSDPTFFRRASTGSDLPNGEKSQRERKARKLKRRRSRQQIGQLPNCAPIPNGSSRMQFSSPIRQGQSSLARTGSTFDMTFKSDMGDQSDSLGSKDGMDFTECVLRSSTSIEPDEAKSRELFSGLDEPTVNSHESNYRDDIPCTPTMKTAVPCSSSVMWDEKTEIVQLIGPNCETGDIEDVRETNFDTHEFRPENAESVNQVDHLSAHDSTPKSNVNGNWPETIIVGNFTEPTAQYSVFDEVHNMNQTNFDLQEFDLEPANVECTPHMTDLSEIGNSSESIADGNLKNDLTDWKLCIDEVQNVNGFDIAKQELEAMKTEHVNQVDDFPDGEDNLQLIEWNPLDDTGSETDYYVDALTMIESESESDFEGQTQKEKVLHLPSTSKDELVGNTINGQKEEIRSPQEQNAENHLAVYDRKEEVFDHSQHSNSRGIDFCANDDGIRLNLAVCEIAANDLQGLDDERIYTPCLSQKVVYLPSTSNDQLVEKTINGQKEEISSPQDPNPENHFAVYDPKDGVVDHSQHSNSRGIDFCANDDGIRLKPAVCEIEANDSQAPGDERIHAPYLSEEVVYLLSTSTDELVENTINGQKEEESIPQEPRLEHNSAVYDQKEAVFDDSQHSSSLASSVNMERQKHVQSSCNKSDEQSVQSNQSSPVNSISPGIDFCANDDGVKLEPEVCEFETTDSQALPDERIHTPHTSREMLVGSSSVCPRTFWTNGTLFGLEPSKPPVFSISSTINSSPMSSGNDITVGQPNPSVMQKIGSECGESSKEPKLVNDGQDNGSFKHISHQISNKKHETPVDHDRSSSVDHSVIHGLSNGIAKPRDSKVPLNSDVENISSDASNTSEDRSSLLSFLGRGLLKNGLRRTSSLGYDEKSNTITPVKTNEFTPEINLKEKLNSPVNSPPPSPPLEEMKISFQPIDGFETSRLKLKYPEGIDHHENTIDTFPSFQLIPGPINLQHEIGSDSEDDTFCRSYACTSDDDISRLSDSNSEQWESRDSFESNDRGIFDGLRRISSTESTSSSPRPHLPNLDANNLFAYQEMKLSLNPEDVESSQFQEPTPQPPPLPPFQWRVSRHLLDGVEGKQNPSPGSLNHSFDAKLSGCAIPRLIKVDSAKPLTRTEESPTTLKENKLDEQNSDEQKQNYQAANGMRADNKEDKEDFLHQIRTKSFNLRRIGKAPSSNSPSPATSNKVTAILQKANAIRQAVGSDTGEDDSWSDT